MGFLATSNVGLFWCVCTEGGLPASITLFGTYGEV